MKKTLCAFLIIALALVVVSSAFVVASAETTPQAENDATGVTIIDDGGRAYELIWKYKEQDGHVWKRRWNMTTGEWYDPAWILVV